MFVDMIYFLRISVIRFLLSAFANMMVFDVDLMFTTDVFSFKGDVFCALVNIMSSNHNRCFKEERRWDVSSLCSAEQPDFESQNLFSHHLHLPLDSQLDTVVHLLGSYHHHVPR